MSWRYIKMASLAKCLYWRSGFFVKWIYYEEAVLVKGRYLYKVTLLVKWSYYEEVLLVKWRYW